MVSIDDNVIKTKLLFLDPSFMPPFKIIPAHTRHHAENRRTPQKTKHLAHPQAELGLSNILGSNKNMTIRQRLFISEIFFVKKSSVSFIIIKEIIQILGINSHTKYGML